MTFEEFKLSLQEKNPPEGLNNLLLALWYDGKGDWERSHSITQDIDTKDAALIHAYLHRKEGDEWNADFWYKKAHRSNRDVTIEEEFELLVAQFLETM